MAQLKGKQIANASIAAAKIDLSDTFDFTSGAVSVGNPSSNNDAANKAYVDSVTTSSSAGLDFKESVVVASTSNFAGTYSSLVLTASDVGAITIDSVQLSLNDRVLLKDQSTGAENGLYTVTTVGDASNAGVLTRASDADSSADLTTGAFIFVERGTENQNKSYVLQAHTDGSSPTLDTDALTFIQFSGAGQITAGDGISKSGDTLALDINGLTAVADQVFSDDQVVVYDDSVSGPRKRGATNFVNDVMASSFEVSGNKVAPIIKSSGGVIAGSNGFAVSGNNTSSLAASSLTSSFGLFFVTSSNPRQVAFDDFLAQLAGVGIEVSGTTLKAGLPQLDSGSAGSTLSTDESATGITISATPLDDSDVAVTVNGVGIELGDGVKSKDAYFSADSGTTPRAIADIASGDELFWNGASAYALETDDIVEIRFNA